jgi:hypothetical protein
MLLESCFKKVRRLSRELWWTESPLAIFENENQWETVEIPSVTPRIFAVNFFFSLLAKIRALPFPFLFPSLNLDLFQSSSGIRFGIPVRMKTLNTLCCLMHHAEPCISFDCFESAIAFM